MKFLEKLEQLCRAGVERSLKQQNAHLSDDAIQKLVDAEMDLLAWRLYNLVTREY